MEDIQLKLKELRQFRGTKYYVSQEGEVFRYIPKYRGVPARLRKRTPTLTIWGYHKLNIGRKSITIHKIVMEVFAGPRPDGMHINHKNGIKTDNRFENLEYVTPSRNQCHAIELGLAQPPKGSGKLSAEQVLKIRRSKLGRRKLAKKYGVDRTTIRDIKKRKIWKWL